VYGTLNFLIEGYDLEAVKTMVVEISASASRRTPHNTAWCVTTVF